MSWYNEERNGSTKAYLEWFCGRELEPDEEAGFYKKKVDTVSLVSSMIMLDRCRIFSESRNTEVYLFEPDDRIELYIDFLEEINPHDWGNDMYLFDLVEAVFHRKQD